MSRSCHVADDLPGVGYCVVHVNGIWFVSLPTESSPPTASSRPCGEVHVDKITGVSASWCHTLGLVAKEVLSCAPRDCNWQDWRRAASEQVNTDFDCLSFWSQPPSIWICFPESVTVDWPSGCGRTTLESLCPSLQQYSFSCVLFPLLLPQPETCHCILPAVNQRLVCMGGNRFVHLIIISEAEEWVSEFIVWCLPTNGSEETFDHC